MHKITDNLWIGDILDAEQGDTSRFDAVITVCQDSVADNVGCTYHLFRLSDGPPEEGSKNPGMFEYDLFESAVDAVISHIESNDVVFVHCHAGRSRSVTVSATALAETRNITLEEAFETISDVRRIQPNEEIVEFARRYVG